MRVGKKTAGLNLRLEPIVKETAELLARKDRRTVTAFLEHLIMEAAEKRGLSLAVPEKRKVRS